MKLLRQTIRKLLLESTSAKILDAIEIMKSKNLKLNFNLKEGYTPRQIAVFLYAPTKYDHNRIRTGVPWREAGYVKTSAAMRHAGDCHDAYEITSTSLHLRNLRGSGIGALMYDVAVEIASMHGFPIMCDRGSVSGDALVMWDYMMNNSADYEVLQLDNDEEPFLTPDDPKDDCDPWSFYKDNNPAGSDGYEQQWMASPITKAYKKKSLGTIDLVKKEGIFITDEELGF